MVKRYLACVLHNRIYRDYIRFYLTKGSLLKISTYSHRPWIYSRIVISLFSPVDCLIMLLLVMLLWYLQFLWIQRLQRYHFLYLNFHFRSFCHFFQSSSQFPFWFELEVRLLLRIGRVVSILWVGFFNFFLQFWIRISPPRFRVSQLWRKWIAWSSNIIILNSSDFYVFC